MVKHHRNHQKKYTRLIKENDSGIIGTKRGNTKKHHADLIKNASLFLLKFQPLHTILYVDNSSNDK